MSDIISVASRVVALAAGLLLWPLGTGFVFLHKRQFDNGLVYLFGLCAMLTIFELVYIPFFALGLSFSLMTAVYFVLISAVAIAGLFLASKMPKLPKAPREKLSKTELVFVLVTAAIIIWQILRTTLGGGTWNIDDAWYLGIANTAMYTDDIFRTDPTIGTAYNYFENMGSYLSYVFSPWPLFLAMFAKLFSFHVLVLARTVLPGFLIIIFYFVIYRLVRFFFREDREKIILAMMLLSVFYEICAVAMNLRFTWIICYPWMGKAFGPSVICPIALFFFMLTEDEEDAVRRKWLWFGCFLANAAGCTVASSSAEIALMLLGCWGLVYIIRRRDFSAIWKLALCCTPSLALMAAHFVV